MFDKYLQLEAMQQLVAGIQASTPPAELGSVRYELLTGINPGFIATSLGSDGNALNLIRSDLNTMNTIPYLLGYEVPLQLWLSNAVQRMRYGRRPELTFFERTLEQVTRDSQQLIHEAQGGTGPAGALDTLERIVHRDDMLHFSWLSGALAVGRSVARLTVYRFENGLPMDGSAYGTGWLMDAGHLITNHHVINARSPGEEDASSADLHLQAANMLVQFDYDAPGAAGEAAAVDSLRAWCPYTADPPLDYAIIRLAAAPAGRRPLTLAPGGPGQIMTRIASGPDNAPAVNLIQHPGGRPKMIATRNNLVRLVSDWELSYFTDTEWGSSGSPVCNDDWRVVGLHRRWQQFVSQNVVFQGKETAWDNRGTRIDRILADLQSNHADLWSELALNVA